jgi:hypothetical protein
MKKLLVAASSLLLALSASAADRNLPRNGLSAFPTVVIPVMANNPGVIPGTFFKTKVAIINPTQLSYPIQVTLYDGNGQAGQATISMAPGQVRNYDNFLEQIFGRSGAGSVVFNSGAGVPGGSAANDFIVSAEVFTDSPTGKYKTVVTSGALLDSVSNLSEAFSLGITVDASTRTNVGAFNDTESPNVINADVYSAAGTLLGTVTLTLPARSWAQVAVPTNVTNGYIRWRTSGLAYCYAVVVDNLSNDGTFIPGAEYAQ